MHDGSRLITLHILLDSLAVGQVKVLHVHTAAFNAPGFQLTHGIPAQLACVSGYEHFHSRHPHIQFGIQNYEFRITGLIYFIVLSLPHSHSG